MINTVDVLFLFRTIRKKRYFDKLCAHALSDRATCVRSYHRLPARASRSIQRQDLDTLLPIAEQELFGQSGNAGMRLLRQLSKPLLRIWIRLIFSSLSGYLEEQRPAIIVLWNGHKIQDHIMHAVNRDAQIPIVYMENGALAGTTTLDFNGINAGSSVPRHADAFSAYSDARPSLAPLKGRAYRKAQISASELPAHYLLVPFQSERDSQLTEYSPWIKTMQQLVITCIDALQRSQRVDLHLVFREHPSSRTRYPELHALAESNPRVHFDNHHLLTESIENAEAIITVNSTVGLEAIVLGRPVVVLGSALYCIDGLAQKAHGIAELTHAIDQLSQWKPDRQLVNRFLNYLANDYLVTGDWRQPDTLHYASVREKLGVHSALHNARCPAVANCDAHVYLTPGTGIPQRHV